MSKLSFAEQKALEAAEFEPFSVQIHDVRRTVEQILNLFGRDGIFSEYTVHSYAHVEAMLEDLDWLLTDQNKSNMTLGDWLMITLAIYFHDMGLIVAQSEFERRDASGFREFCENVLFAKSDGQDYRSKVLQLGHDRAERFLYQEFVRANHAKRVRSWIEGSHFEEFGFSTEQVKEVNGLLNRLHPEFRRDLVH